MFNTLQKQRSAQFIFFLYLFFIGWWLSLQFGTDGFSFQNQLFGGAYWIVAFFGTGMGFLVARKWSFTKSLMGKAIVMFSFGLLAQVFGQLVYSWYTFYARIDVPYPSLGDLGFFGSIPFYIYGIILLARASGVKVSLKTFKNQIVAITVPAAILFLSYYIFLQGYVFDLHNPMKILLDFGYPLGQAIYVSLALLTYLLTRNVLGGVMKNRVLFMLFALTFQYFSDYFFLYWSSKGLAHPGGVIDLFYITSYLLMTIGLLQMRVSQIREQLT